MIWLAYTLLLVHGYLFRKLVCCTFLWPQDDLCKTPQALSFYLGIGCDRPSSSPATNSLLDWGLGFDSATPEHLPCCPFLCSFRCMLWVIVLPENESSSKSSFSCRLNQIVLQDFPLFCCIHFYLLPLLAFHGLLLRSIPTAWCCHHHAAQWGWCSVWCLPNIASSRSGGNTWFLDALWCECGRFWIDS